MTIIYRGTLFYLEREKWTEVVKMDQVGPNRSNKSMVAICL